MSGSDLRKQQGELGVGPEVVCSEAGISMSSLYKVYSDEPVRDSTRMKVVHALARIRARVTNQPEAKTAAG